MTALDSCLRLWRHLFSSHLMPHLGGILGLLFLATACTPPLSQLKEDIPQKGGLTESSQELALDPVGKLDAAKRLCHPLLDDQRKSLGFMWATQAALHFDHTEDMAQKVAANLQQAKCAALLAEEEVDSESRKLFQEVGMNAAKRAGSEAVLNGFCVPPGQASREQVQTTLAPPLRTCDETTLEAAYVHALLAGQRMQEAGMREAMALLKDELTLLNAAMNAPHLDQGGPLRIYGLLLLKAPSWPAGPGDLDKALELLTRATKEFPSHPLNHLFLAMALNEDGDTAAAKAHLETGLKLAREELWGAKAVAKWQNVDALTAVPK